MLVFWEQRLVFLATPKTGSTAIEMALESLAEVSIQRPPILKHTPAYRYRRFLQPYLEKTSGGAFTVVALMREPIDWLGSWYRFRQRDDILDESRSTKGMSFDTFVEGYMQAPKPAFADVGSQAKFLAHKEGQGVDRIFLYEQLDTFVQFLEERLDCAVELPRVNVSPEGETRLSPEVEARLRAACPAEFALYDRVAGDG